MASTEDKRRFLSRQLGASHLRRGPNPQVPRGQDSGSGMGLWGNTQASPTAKRVRVLPSTYAGCVKFFITLFSSPVPRLPGLQAFVQAVPYARCTLPCNPGGVLPGEDPSTWNWGESGRNRSSFWKRNWGWGLNPEEPSIE